jgi:hypothetical protein
MKCGQPSKKPRLSQYVEHLENNLEYLRHCSFGVSDSGSLSLRTTFAISQSDAVQSSPEPSFDAWEETLPNELNDSSFENVDLLQETTVKTKRLQVCMLKFLGHPANV